MLTQDRLKELFHYEPETGTFTQLIRTSSRVNVGDIAGSTNSRGYRSIMVGGKMYFSHRLAWLYVYGIWTEEGIDHINGITNDNRITNLREATKNQNMHNQKKAHCNNKSGFLGVRAQRGKWRASIRYCGKTIHIGIFQTPELAHAAYLRTKRELHPFGTI